MTGLYTSAISTLFFPLQERLKGHDSVAVRRSLEGSQWWDRERTGALQLERLRVLLAHAGERVPYYRQLFKRHGFAPSAIRSVADIGRLPFLTKADIRADIAALKSDDARNLMRYNT